MQPQLKMRTRHNNWLSFDLMVCVRPTHGLTCAIEGACRWVARAVLAAHGANHVVVGMWCRNRHIAIIAVHSLAHHRSRVRHSTTDDSGLVVLEERATPIGSFDPAAVAAGLIDLGRPSEVGVSAVSAAYAAELWQHIKQANGDDHVEYVWVDGAVRRRVGTSESFDWAGY